MSESIKIVANKNHDVNISKLDIPKEIIPYLDLDIINSIANKISTITDKTFNYFGSIRLVGDNTIIDLSSNDKSKVTISLKHNLVFDSEGKPKTDNILFDGITKLLDKKIEEQKKIIQSNPSNISKYLESLNDETTKQIENEKKENEERINKEQQDKKLSAIKNVLGIESDVEHIEYSESALKISENLDVVKEDIVKRKEQTKEEKATNLNAFMSALDNLKINDDTQQQKKDLFIKKLNTNLDKLANGSI